jgi:hypothetical protein
MALRKVTASVDEEGYDELKTYKEARGLQSVDEAASTLLKMGLNRQSALNKYAKGKGKAAKAAAKPKAAKAAKPKKEKVAAKAKSKPKAAVAAPKKAAASAAPKKAQTNKKVSPLVAATAKKSGVSRLGPQKPTLVGPTNGTPVPPPEAVAEA